MLQPTPLCASASLNVCIVTGVSIAPASVIRHLIPFLAASPQPITSVFACEPGIAVRSRNPLPSSQTTSEYSDCVAALRPNHRSSRTAQGVPAPDMTDPAIAFTSLFFGGLQTNLDSRPCAMSPARAPSASRQEIPIVLGTPPCDSSK